MSLTTRAQLEQRSDYTHKFNADLGRHGWLRLTPAYSVKIVENIISQYATNKVIFDPFCGSGTTALCAINLGHNSVTADVNPFLVWLARAKTYHYSTTDIGRARKIGNSIFIKAQNKNIEPAVSPPIHNIRRWWTRDIELLLCRIKSGILQIAESHEQESDLLKVIFCRTLIQLSNADFNHQSMSFKDARLQHSTTSVKNTFNANLDFVINSALKPSRGNAKVILGNSCNLSNIKTKFDIVVTSPPYANRMSYIRELRPYMYWLDYISNGRDAGEMDWNTIGGTWGIATSKLSSWKMDKKHWVPKYMSGVLRNIVNQGDKNGSILSNYVGKYCEDMSKHFKELHKHLHLDARIHYIIGNSTFYGVLVPTEKIYGDMMVHYGFDDVKIRAIRKRNSKKELKEFEVSALWPS